MYVVCRQIDFHYEYWDGVSTWVHTLRAAMKYNNKRTASTVAQTVGGFLLEVS